MGNFFEDPAQADERRANQLETCRGCKKVVDGFEYDRYGGYCQKCGEANKKAKKGKRGSLFDW